MLYIFDKDGTLVSGSVNRPANTPAEQILLPGVAHKIATLKAEGHQIAIASNQGGVAWGFISIEQANELLWDCAQKIGGADAWTLCPHDDRKNEPCECRKPKPGMLIHLMQYLEFSLTDTVMVGDQLTDQKAAESAGVKFFWAHEFFNS